MQDTRRLLVFRETLISYRTKLQTYLPNIQRNTFKEIFTILRDARRLFHSLRLIVSKHILISNKLCYRAPKSSYCQWE